MAFTCVRLRCKWMCAIGPQWLCPWKAEGLVIVSACFMLCGCHTPTGIIDLVNVHVTSLQSTMSQDVASHRVPVLCLLDLLSREGCVAILLTEPP